MPRSMVGLLAAVSVAMPALAAYAHGTLALAAIVMALLVRLSSPTWPRCQ